MACESHLSLNEAWLEVVDESADHYVACSIGAVYQSGYYRMSTWIPFVWAFINTLVLILSSFAIQGGL